MFSTSKNAPIEKSDRFFSLLILLSPSWKYTKVDVFNPSAEQYIRELVLLPIPIASHVHDGYFSVGIDRETRSLHTLLTWRAHTHASMMMKKKKRREWSAAAEKGNGIEIERSINSVINTQASKQTKHNSTSLRWAKIFSFESHWHTEHTPKQNEKPYSFSLYIYNQSYAWLRDLYVFRFSVDVSFAAAYALCSLLSLYVASLW